MFVGKRITFDVWDVYFKVFNTPETRICIPVNPVFVCAKINLKPR